MQRRLLVIHDDKHKCPEMEVKVHPRLTHTNVFCQFHNENSAQDAYLINICTYCSTIKYFSSLCTLLHATANQTNEHCQAEKCGFRPDNGGKPGAVHGTIPSVCLQLSGFSHKNMWEKTLPRYVPYSSCKGVQMYEPSREEGIKDIYYFYCSAWFKNSSFSAKNILPTICLRCQSLQGSTALQSTFSHHQTAESWHNNHHHDDTKGAVQNSQAVNLAIFTSNFTIIKLSDKCKVN